MPETLDLQSEQFMTLLTDALRAGPGSPEWNQAVKALRGSNKNADELMLLTTARERLESGKEYRSVLAGPGFTRKVLEGIDNDNGASGMPAANVIALAAGVILAVVIVIGIHLLKSSDPGRQAIDDLTGQIFGNKFLTASFPGPATQASKLPDGWNQFGEVPLATKAGELRPAPLSSTLPATTEADGYKVGGIVSALSFASDQVLEIDVGVRLYKPADNSIAEVFVSDEPISDGNAGSAHALVWQCKAGEARVFLADGNATPHAEKIANARELTIKILLNRVTAVVDTAGQRTYAGPHHLAQDKPRYVGVRFRRRPGDKGEYLGITNVTIQKP